MARLLDIFARFGSGSGRRDVGHSGMLGFSGLGTSVDGSALEGGRLIKGGLLDWGGGRDATVVWG